MEAVSKGGGGVLKPIGDVHMHVATKHSKASICHPEHLSHSHLLCNFAPAMLQLYGQKPPAHHQRTSQHVQPGWPCLPFLQHAIMGAKLGLVANQLLGEY